MTHTLTPTRYALTGIIAFTLLAAALLACLCIGVSDSPTHLFNLGWPEPVILQIRLLRLLSAATVGFSLAAAGLTLQALLRNPLADPYILGISSGSSVGVMLWLLLTGPLYMAAAASPFLQHFLTQTALLPAILGAAITCVLVISIARAVNGSRTNAAGGGDVISLLLIGVVISAINGALLMLLNSLAPAGVRINFLNYLMGAISNDITWRLLLLTALIALLGYAPILLSGQSLNIATLSPQEALSLGVDLQRLRRRCFFSASLVTGAAIILAGPIGFVGLICPHICRRLFGPDHRLLTLITPLAGALFLLLTDTFVSITGRLFHGELPVGVLTALCGGPFFLFLLANRNARSTH